MTFKESIIINDNCPFNSMVEYLLIFLPLQPKETFHFAFGIIVTALMLVNVSYLGSEKSIGVIFNCFQIHVLANNRIHSV